MAHSSAGDLDKLIHDLEYENQQYVKEIEKEKQMIKHIEKEDHSLREEILMEQKLQVQLDYNLKTFHKQFTCNRDNINSLKNTVDVYKSQEEALQRRLDEMKISFNLECQEHEAVLKRYQHLWEDYEVVYSKFPLTIKLKEAKEKNEEVKLQKAERLAELQCLKNEKLKLENQFKPYANVNDFIMKFVELRYEVLKQDRKNLNLEEKIDEVRKAISKREEEVRVEGEKEAQKKQIEEEEERQQELERKQREEAERIEELQREEVRKKQEQTKKEEEKKKREELQRQERERAQQNVVLRQVQPSYMERQIHYSATDPVPTSRMQPFVPRIEIPKLTMPQRLVPQTRLGYTPQASSQHMPTNISHMKTTGVILKPPSPIQKPYVPVQKPLLPIQAPAVHLMKPPMSVQIQPMPVNKSTMPAHILPMSIQKPSMPVQKTPIPVQKPATHIQMQPVPCARIQTPQWMNQTAVPVNATNQKTSPPKPGPDQSVGKSNATSVLKFPSADKTPKTPGRDQQSSPSESLPTKTPPHNVTSKMVALNTKTPPPASLDIEAQLKKIKLLNAKSPGFTYGPGQNMFDTKEIQGEDSEMNFADRQSFSMFSTPTTSTTHSGSAMFGSPLPSESSNISSPEFSFNAPTGGASMFGGGNSPGGFSFNTPASESSAPMGFSFGDSPTTTTKKNTSDGNGGLFSMFASADDTDDNTASSDQGFFTFGSSSPDDSAASGFGSSGGFSMF